MYMTLRSDWKMLVVCPGSDLHGRFGLLCGCELSIKGIAGKIWDTAVQVSGLRALQAGSSLASPLHDSCQYQVAIPSLHVRLKRPQAKRSSKSKEV